MRTLNARARANAKRGIYICILYKYTAKSVCWLVLALDFGPPRVIEYGIESKSVCAEFVFIHKRNSYVAHTNTHTYHNMCINYEQNTHTRTVIHNILYFYTILHTKIASYCLVFRSSISIIILNVHTINSDDTLKAIKHIDILCMHHKYTPRNIVHDHTRTNYTQHNVQIIQTYHPQHVR